MVENLSLVKRIDLMEITSLKCLAIMLLTVAVSSSAFAQKLPNMQGGSVQVPAKIKIDGKPTEWETGMQAYNRAIQAQYTVANDNKRLYLIVRADKREIINKMINGGVSFSINKSNKRTTNDAVTITYPVFAWNNRPIIGFNHLSDALANEKDQKKRDSVMLGCNNSLEDKAKYIRVNNLPEVDTLISVYNTDGIKAKSGFDDKLVYTVELGIDLKTLNLSAAEAKQFSYNIRLNAAPQYVPGIEVARDESGKITSINITSVASIYYAAAQSDTDCWGEYTLAK